MFDVLHVSIFQVPQMLLLVLREVLEVSQQECLYHG